MERLSEAISFTASDKDSPSVLVDAKYVDDYLIALVPDEDLSRYI